jgi:hypothetical protein
MSRLILLTGSSLVISCNVDLVLASRNKVRRAMDCLEIAKQA